MLVILCPEHFTSSRPSTRTVFQESEIISVLLTIQESDSLYEKYVCSNSLVSISFKF